jgi:hypothetical protein
MLASERGQSNPNRFQSDHPLNALILSEAKDMLCASSWKCQKHILRFTQDDRVEVGTI